VPLTCYFDGFSGLSGDVLVGALADAGADQTAITDAIASSRGRRPRCEKADEKKGPHDDRLAGQFRMRKETKGPETVVASITKCSTPANG
jgi:hypothetical protein